MTKPKMPKVAPATPPVAMRSTDIINTERDAMEAERRKKGLGATILAGAYKPGAQGAQVMQPTLGRRSILGSVTL